MNNLRNKLSILYDDLHSDWEELAKRIKDSRERGNLAMDDNALFLLGLQFENTRIAAKILKLIKENDNTSFQ